MRDNHLQQIASVILIGCCMGCGSGTPSNAATSQAACPRDGTVLADMRDVERDAEGVSYAVFGAAPEHAPDYKRAAGVLSLLRQVWTRSVDKCPKMPAVAVDAVDAAIAKLKTAIPAEDQAASAYAANDIHRQMAPLFKYFKPDTPVAVVSMDALFLRVGVDAWNDDWEAFSKNLDLINSDWSTLKSAAAAKVPMCNRVAGTASVVDDIDQTLASLADAAANKDVSLAETGSEDGLLEVDILELLFDCPAGTKPPATGLGSACSADGDCVDGLICNQEVGMGRCAPSSESTHVGDACTTTVDCGTYSRNACNNDVGDGYPGGYCSMEPCDDVQICSPGATCVAMPFETPACLKSCQKDSDCREGEGYVCQLFPTMPPKGFGPSDHACAFPCTSDDQCTAPLTCVVATGKCSP